jgi:hypothetical protein
MGQAKLEPYAQAAVLDAATRVYSVAGCRDFARVDLRLEPARVQVLEINTNPWGDRTGPTPSRPTPRDVLRRPDSRDLRAGALERRAM